MANKPIQAKAGAQEPSPAQFQTYRCIAKVTESTIITSFLLRPEMGETPDFCPGEHLLFDLPCGPNGAMIRREYSISGLVNGALRVTIKREPAAAGYAPGAGSGYFHDNIRANSTLRAAGPFGQFRLDRASSRPVVLLSGGVGLTPIVAMARELATGTRPFSFIHACENGAVHAMGEEMRALAKTSPMMTTHFCYRLLDQSDTQDRNYDSIGFLTADTLQSLMSPDDHDFYLCGPGPFMQAIYEILADMGVSNDRIRYEFFGPATLLRASGKSRSSPPPERAEKGSNAPMVTFAKSGLRVPWDTSIANLLEFAEEHGFMPDFGCRAGTCKSCRTHLVSGQTDYLFEPFERPDDGCILICCSVPKGDITLGL